MRRKAWPWARGLPLVGVNHLEGHLYSAWIYNAGELAAAEPQFPLMALLVSGGHTELDLMTDHLEYRRLGSTLDDAAGEAFDKVARLLGLGYPGGPAIQEAAANGDPRSFRLPAGVVWKAPGISRSAASRPPFCGRSRNSSTQGAPCRWPTWPPRFRPRLWMSFYTRPWMRRGNFRRTGDRGRRRRLGKPEACGTHSTNRSEFTVHIPPLWLVHGQCGHDRRRRLLSAGAWARRPNWTSMCSPPGRSPDVRQVCGACVGARNANRTWVGLTLVRLVRGECTLL